MSELNDALLRCALLDAQREDWAEVMEGAPEPEFSPAYRRRRMKLLSAPFAYGKRRTRPLWRRVLQTAACLLLALILTAGGVLAVSPAAREWVGWITMEWGDIVATFRFGGKGRQVDASQWVPSYVPEGFEVVDVSAVMRGIEITYKNADGTRIDYICDPLEKGRAYAVDNEHSDLYDITINGNQATLMACNTEGYNSYLVWADEVEGTAHMLASEIDYRELIQMAESLVKQPPVVTETEPVDKFGLSRLPEGYEQDGGWWHVNNRSYTEYMNYIRDWVEFVYAPLEHGEEIVSEGNAGTTSQVMVNGAPAVLLTGDNGTNELIWTDETLEIVCRLRSKLSGSDLIWMAEGVRREN